MSRHVKGRVGKPWRPRTSRHHCTDAVSRPYVTLLPLGSSVALVRGEETPTAGSQPGNRENRPHQPPCCCLEQALTCSALTAVSACSSVHRSDLYNTCSSNRSTPHRRHHHIHFSVGVGVTYCVRLLPSPGRLKVQGSSRYRPRTSNRASSSEGEGERQGGEEDRTNP